MGILFLLAGYFVPGAFDRKGFRRFMADRFVRLGLPSLIYIFVIQPFLMHYLLQAGKGGMADYYRTFLASGDWLTGGGPMWFAIALLIFLPGLWPVQNYRAGKGENIRSSRARPGQFDGHGAGDCRVRVSDSHRGADGKGLSSTFSLRSSRSISCCSRLASLPTATTGLSACPGGSVTDC